MKKVVDENMGMVRIGNAVIPCDTTPNTIKTFDAPLVAKLGETVFYLQPEFKNLQDNGDFEMWGSTSSVIKGTICRIDCATGCATCLDMQIEGSEEKVGAVQELFFRSLEEAAEVVAKVNEYTKANSIWRGDWYEIYKGLFQPSYPYTLKFPLGPLQTQKICKRGKRHYIIPNRVIAEIEEGEARIQYQGKDTKPEYISGRKVVGMFMASYFNEYEIVSNDKKN